MESQKLSPEALRQKAEKIKLVALDMDGTLTDGSINIGAEGELFKRLTPKTAWALLRPGNMVLLFPSLPAAKVLSSSDGRKNWASGKM